MSLPRLSPADVLAQRRKTRGSRSRRALRESLAAAEACISRFAYDRSEIEAWAREMLTRDEGHRKELLIRGERLDAQAAEQAALQLTQVQLDGQVSELRREVENLTHEGTLAQQREVALTEQLRDTTKAREDDREKNNALLREVRAEVAAALAEAKALGAQLSDRQNELERVQNLHQVAVIQSKGLNEESKRRHDDLLAAEADVRLEHEANTILRSQLSSASQREGSIQQALEHAHSEVQRGTNELQTARRAAHAMEAQHADAEARITALRAESDATLTELAGARASEQSTQLEAAALRDELETLRSDLDESHQAVDLSLGELRVLQERDQVLASEVITLQTQLDEAVAGARDAARIFETTLNGRQELLEGMDRERATVQSALNSLTAEHDSLQKEMVLLSEAGSGVAAERQRLENLLEESERRHDALAHEHAAAVDELSRASERVDQVRSELDAERSAHSRVQIDTALDLTRMAEERDSLLHEVDRLRTQIEATEAEQAEATAAAENIEEAPRGHLEMVRSMEAEQEQLRTQVDLLIEQNVKSAVDMSLQAAEINRLHAEVEAATGIDQDQPLVAPSSGDQVTSGQVPLTQDVLLAGFSRADVDRLLASIGTSGRAWAHVALAANVSPSALQDALPAGWALQPDGWTQREPDALVYRAAQRASSNRSAQQWYTFVDALAAMLPMGLLDESVLETLAQTLPAVHEIPSGMVEHLLARARWRTRSPADLDAVQQQLMDEDAAHRDFLLLLLHTTLHKHPGLDLPARLSALGFDLHAPVEKMPAPRTPLDAVRRPQAVTWDGARLAERREETDRARAALLSLEEEEVDPLEDQAAPDRLQPPIALSANLLSFALWLSTAEVHDLATVRHELAAKELSTETSVPALNEWAEWQAERVGVDLKDAAVEVDNEAHEVWVDASLGELLR